jgi:transcriptional regulator with XRE-family HTH domain
MSADEKSFEGLFRQAEQTSEFWRQAATLDFAEDLARLMETAGVTRAELARRLGTSAASVTQALRADRNLTVDTMTRLAMVFGHRVCVHLAPQDSVTTWQDAPCPIRGEPGSQDDPSPEPLAAALSATRRHSR